jgi:hypothetical protein
MPCASSVPCVLGVDQHPRLLASSAARSGCLDGWVGASDRDCCSGSRTPDCGVGRSTGTLPSGSPSATRGPAGIPGPDLYAGRRRLAATHLKIAGSRTMIEIRLTAALLVPQERGKEIKSVRTGWAARSPCGRIPTPRRPGRPPGTAEPTLLFQPVSWRHRPGRSSRATPSICMPRSRSSARTP